ncbi:SpoIIE family protein phosphatase [Paenibacillus sp. TRM 82003]|uniref:SpoIIE family protein phosphatase n=1 Tax=Kineococcus sp. TRM81007 TaxID=2925831 RepID=UPI001F55B105|nr:SpoIIE family protein phosphatase [Kineococcus sp. TRM81007]MCI2239613.1 SpoIIE family protein phosphatase [Kineococcus sp. TRM81007]MCI3926105.1 SpoIIE family protein phosphatase [Paenibacillus sp. TRM 82003]
MTAQPAVDPAADLSLVSGGAPAAVLVVDLTARAVVHANPVAEQLAPGVPLPVGLDEWSDAAELRDLDGAALSGTEHPLSRVARSQPVAGQAVSAARLSELGRRREPLWVVALPTTGAPALDGHAIVVLLPLSRRAAARAAADAAQAQAQVRVRDRAVLATGMAFTVADARADDLPLVWVNPAFTAMTGYAVDEVVGRNCRFLQGPGTDREVVAAVRDALAAGEEVSATLLNHRKDGTAFWNQLLLSPVHGADGELTHYVGIQTDVTPRVAADAERDEALAAERRARADAETARAQAEAARRDAEESRARLEVLAEATSRLAVTLDVDECRQRLLELTVPALADWAILLTTDERGSVAGVTARHRDPARAGDLERYVQRWRAAFAPGPVRSTLLGGAHARRISDYDGEPRRRERESWVNDSSVLELSDALGAASVLLVTLPRRQASEDVLALVRGPGRPRHTDDDLHVAVDLGRRAGLIIDNARLYGEQHRIAATLQNSLLPQLPSVPGVRAAARYRASESGARVGGDFYELIDLPGSAVGLAVGDVVGHDVMAAAAMGHLRGLLRASAWDTTNPAPATVLDRVDRLLDGLGMTTMATLAYARATPSADGGWVLEHATAGHPPLLVRHPDGHVEALDDVHGLMLGVQPTSRVGARRALAPGATVLAYTDGLVERRGEELTTGLERLARTLADAPADVEALCDHLLQRLGDTDDDVAFVALRLGP